MNGKPLPGALEAIAQLSQAGWTVCVATNQSGIGRGLFTIVDLHGMHEKMQRQVGVARRANRGCLFLPPHTGRQLCLPQTRHRACCDEIAARYNVNMQDVPVIGDSARDLQAAEAVGARPILVRTGNGRKTLRTQYKNREVEVYDDLSAAVAALIAGE